MSQVASGPSPSLLGLSQWFLELPASCLLSITSCPLWNVIQPRTPPSDSRLIPRYHLNALTLKALKNLAQVQYCVSHVSHHLYHSPDPHTLQFYEGNNQNGETVRTKRWGGQGYRLRDQRRAHWGADICARNIWGVTTWRSGKDRGLTYRSSNMKALWEHRVDLLRRPN